MDGVLFLGVEREGWVFMLQCILLDCFDGARDEVFQGLQDLHWVGRSRRVPIAIGMDHFAYRQSFRLRVNSAEIVAFGLQSVATPLFKIYE